MEEFDIHHHRRTLEAKLQWLEKTNDVNEADKKLIQDFYRESVSRGMSMPRHIKYLLLLSQLSKMLKIGFSNATKDDIRDLIVRIEQSHYSDWYKKDYKIATKYFYKWLRGNGEEYPQEVRWIKTTFRNEKHKLPEELLTEEEVKRLAEATEHPRDRAFVLILYESGCRIAELLTLRLKNVSFDQFGAILRVRGKTGDRRVRIVSSAPALSAWLDLHPQKSNPENPLWISRASRRMLLPFNYSTGNVLLRRLAKKVGIGKRVNPHIFRHSRATALASKLTEAQMKEYFGWTQSSEMASVYVHLSGRDVDGALLALHGLAKPEDKKEDQMKVCFCPRCQEKNSPVAKFCIRCGTPMNIQALVQIETEKKVGDNIMDHLMQNQEFKEFLYRKVTELGLEKQL